MVQARDQGWPPAVAGSVAIAGAGAGFLLMRHAGRGCLCDPGRAAGPGTALALSGHRLLEGVAVTLGGSPGDEVSVLMDKQVVILGAGGVARTIAAGLSRRGADGSWGPVRWQTVDVDGRGIGRVENLAPGAYRVQRTFRTRAGGALRPLAGKWLNGTVVVQVQAGKTVTLLPLKKVP